MVKKMNQIYYEYKRKLLHLFIFTFVLLIIGLFVFFYVFDQIFNGLLVDAFLILNININQVYDAFLFLIMIAAGMIWLIFMIKNYQQAILEINDLSDEKTPEKQIQELEKIAQDIEALMTRYKHLQAIQDREMHQKEELIQSLNEATIKAEHSIPKLKSATESTSGELKEVVDNAKTLKDDLMFINERADNLADRLENVIHNGRQVQDKANTTDSSATSPKVSQPQPSTSSTNLDRSEAELELLKALRAIK